MASLQKYGKLAQHLAYAESIGLKYVPLSEHQLDILSGRAKTTQSADDDEVVVEDSEVQSFVFEHKTPTASGYYRLYPTGWALLSVGPSMNRGIAIPWVDYVNTPKVDGWATRVTIGGAERTQIVEVGDIVNTVVPPKTPTFLAKVVSVDADGYPVEVEFRDKIFKADAMGEWEKIVGKEQASLYMWNEGRDTFPDNWYYGSQAGKVMKMLNKKAALERERERERANPKLKPRKPSPLADQFLKNIDKAQKPAPSGAKKGHR